MTIRNHFNVGIRETMCSQEWESISQTNMSASLDTEIVYFLKRINPSHSDLEKYDCVIREVRQAIVSEWPLARLELFGSRATGLSLPSSDFDFSIWNIPNPNLYKIKNVLIRDGVCSSSDVQVITKAKIPIIKFRHQSTNLKVDMRFGDADRETMKTVELAKSYCQTLPMLKPMYLVLKKLLIKYSLNEVYTGGLSSYGLLLMCIGYLELSSTKKDSVSSCLLGFLKYFGQEFNYSTTAAHIKHTGAFTKTKKEDYDSYLFIDNPLKPGVNVATKSYRADLLKPVFKKTYESLRAVNGPDTLRDILK